MASPTAIILGLILIAAATPRVRSSELAQAPVSYPLCAANALAGFPWTHPAFGKRLPGIALRNMTLSTCRIIGFPRIEAFSDDGRHLSLQIDRRMFADTKPFAYSVTPGSAVFFALYGNPPRGEFDQTCVGIARYDVRILHDPNPIKITIATGTCGGRLTVSQIFPVGELTHERRP